MLGVRNRRGVSSVPSHWRRAAFLTIAAAATIAVGIAFLLTGWRDATNRAAIGGLALVGIVAAAASVRLSLTGRHGWAAASAVVAIVTPTGFAHLPNLTMLLAAGNEARCAFRLRTPTSADE